jgi:hypothetical protein
MVSLSTWLLSFSAATIWYEAIRLIGDDELTGDHALRVRMVSGLGLAVSLTAGYGSLMFAGYSNQNWRKADEIAELNRWFDLLPSKDMRRGWKLSDVAERLARPCDPFTQLALVFWVFLLLSASAMAAHLAVFVCSFMV